MSEDSEAAPLIDQYVHLFYEEVPRFDIDALTAAWAEEGYECQAEVPRREKGEEVLAFRGGTLVIVSGLTRSIEDRFAAPAQRLSTFDYDWSRTHVVEPRAALRDLARARFAVQVRTRVERPVALAMAANDLVCTLLGIDRVHPFVAAWFEGPSLLVGRADLTEYLAYQDTRQQATSRTPDSLLFSLVLSGEAPLTLGTKGLAFFEHPELYAHAGSFDPVPVLYNAAAHVVSGVTLRPGQTMSMPQGVFRVVAGEWEGHPALQLIVG